MDVVHKVKHKGAHTFWGCTLTFITNAIRSHQSHTFEWMNDTCYLFKTCHSVCYIDSRGRELIGLTVGFESQHSFLDC